MKKTIALFLSMITVVISLFSLNAFASEKSLNVICPFCTNGYGILTCAAEYVKYDTGTHKYNFGKDTCNITWFRSSSAYVCENCRNVIEYYGYHDCLEFHDSCSIGAYNTCPCGGLM